MPVPGIPAISAATPTPANTRVADLLKARLISGGLTAVQALAMLPNLLPLDLLAGLKMNVNRPFGNGRDYDQTPGDDTTGVIDADQPLPPTKPKQVTLATDSAYRCAVPGKLRRHEHARWEPASVARQLEARYLYVLMCLTCDLNYLNKPVGNGPRDAMAQLIAQWAVNAVDFKSRSSIMTPFDYDPRFAGTRRNHDQQRLETAGAGTLPAFGAASGRTC